MKITIETEEKTEISTQTTTATKTAADQMDGGTSPTKLEPTEETTATTGVEKTESVDAGQPPSWLVEAIESSASSKPTISQKITDAGSGPTK